MTAASLRFTFPRFSGVLAVWLCYVASFPELSHAQAVKRPHGNIDVRVNPMVPLANLPGISAAAPTQSQGTPARKLEDEVAKLKAEVPGAEVTISTLTRSVEIVSAAQSLTVAAPNRSGFDIVKDFIRTNAALYGLADDDIANLRFIGESVSRSSRLRMVRVEQMVNGLPVFQSDTRFMLDRAGRLIRSVGLLVPDASATAAAFVTTVSAQAALVSAMASVDLVIDPAGLSLANTQPDGRKTEVVAKHPQISGTVPSELVYFPIAPGVLILAWSQVTMTDGEGDWYTLVDANTGTLLWRKNIRAHASTQEARFSVYVQADGKTPADSPSPLSPTTATPGSGLQPPGIARTTVNMSAVQDLGASPNGWITDGGTTTTGNNVDAYMDADSTANTPDTSVAFRLDGNGRPAGNPDASTRNRDFLGTTPRDFTMTPPPQGGNPESGQTATGNGNSGNLAIDAFRRGVVTHLFYIANWYHDQLYALGFDEAAGNFQSSNFSGQGSGGDRVLAEAQDSSGTDNANFATPPDGQSGRMQMYTFIGPTVDRDGSLDAEIVVHELTHGLSNRLIGNGAGLNWDVGGGMGEGWSDFYALSLLNNSNSDNPNGKYAAGAYATYKLASPIVTNNYLYGIRRFPYCTDNSVNPLTWADVDDVTFNFAGGIPASPLNFSGNGACEVHNIGEIWCNTLWEVRSRVIGDPAGANGDVPTGNNTMLQLVTDGMKMTPLNPSFIDARDALIAADAAANAAANELSIWQGFADRGLGYKAVAPYSRVAGWLAGHVSIGESFDVPYLDVENVAIDDTLGNNNGAIDPGESVRIMVRLKNPWRNASFGVASVTATLSTVTASVNIITTSATYPAIPALGSADGTQFQFSVPLSATAGQALRFTVTPTSALGTKAVDFTLRVGTPSGNGSPITYTRTFAGGLAIPDNSARGVVDTLTITDDYEIADLNFRIDSMTHTWVGDITTLLRSPSGLGTDLITLVGYANYSGSGGSSGDNFTNTVIDDQSSGNLLTALNTAAPFTGSWRAMFNNNWQGADPVGELSRYNGLSTKGDWKVLVSDQASGDMGTLNAWSLIVTPKAYSVTPFVAPVVVGRHVFYNHSAWDENDTAANANDDSAVAADKTALLPGGTAAFANYTSYSRGLNGIMVDIANPAGVPGVSDFNFKVGNDNNPAGWATAPDPVSLTSRALGGGVTRLTLIWMDNNLDAIADANEAVAKQWLEVTVKATANTGLAADDVFYFGNALGECGNSPTAATVDTTDVLLPFYNQTSSGAAILTSAYDINRDRSVDTTDVLLPFYHQTGVGTALVLLDLSASASSVSVGAPSQPKPMSLPDLAALFAGQIPDPNWGVGGASTNRVGRLTLQRVGTDQLRLHLEGVSGEWELQFSDDPQRAPWQKAEAPPQVSPEGPTWFLQIGPAKARFFRALAVPTPTPNP